MSFCSWFGGEKYRDHFEHGVYACSECQHPLFPSSAKYAHNTPWPAFTTTVSQDSLKRRKESASAFKVLCGKCGNGLGHEFLKDGPDGGSRF